uniref:Uncharacterized protein n=1 Tax=Cacopsylla melanoneura TaxID=428564 RepID=A0A8D8XWH7_9HEMI
MSPCSNVVIPSTQSDTIAAPKKESYSRKFIKYASNKRHAVAETPRTGLEKCEHFNLNDSNENVIQKALETSNLDQVNNMVERLITDSTSDITVKTVIKHNHPCHEEAIDKAFRRPSTRPNPMFNSNSLLFPKRNVFSPHSFSKEAPPGLCEPFAKKIESPTMSDSCQSPVSFESTRNSFGCSLSSMRSPTDSMLFSSFINNPSSCPSGFIQQRRPEIPAVFVTAHPVDDDLSQRLEKIDLKEETPLVPHCIIRPSRMNNIDKQSSPFCSNVQTSHSTVQSKKNKSSLFTLSNTSYRSNTDCYSNSPKNINPFTNNTLDISTREPSPNNPFLSANFPTKLFTPESRTATSFAKSDKKKTCTVIGDSHVRDFYKYLRETGNDKYSYHVQCNPGKSLTHLKTEFSSSLDQDDCLVLFGGSNDIFHTPWTQLKNYLFSFLQKNCTKLRIVVVGIPYRYNTPAANTHIKRLNLKIRLVVNIFKNSVFLDTNKRINKRDYLYDKLHLNKNGKLKLCTSLNKVIENDNIFLEKNKGMKKAHTKKRDENVPSENKMKHYENKKTLEILNVSDSNSDKNNRFIAHKELTSKRKNAETTHRSTEPMIVVDLTNVQNTQNSYQTNKSKVTRNPKPHRTSPQLSGHQDTVRVQHVPVISYNHQSEQETIRTSTTQPVDPHPQSEPAYTLHKEQEHTMPPIGQLRGSNPGPQTTAPTPCKQTGQTQSMPHPVQLQASNLVPAHYQLPHPAYRANGYYNNMIPIPQAASSASITNLPPINPSHHHHLQHDNMPYPMHYYLAPQPILLGNSYLGPNSSVSPIVNYPHFPLFMTNPY